MSVIKTMPGHTLFASGLLLRASANAIFGAVLALALWASLTPALAQVNVHEPDPAVWLRQIYDFYQRSEKNPESDPQPSFGLVVERASKSLAALFKKNDECEAKQGGVCALDWDFVIDGQDFQLSNVKVADAVVAGDKATVTASFTNMGATCVNTYSFVREDGEWKGRGHRDQARLRRAGADCEASERVRLWSVTAERALCLHSALGCLPHPATCELQCAAEKLAPFVNAVAWIEAILHWAESQPACCVSGR